MTPDSNPTPTDEPARWAPITLDAWRQLREERDARLEAERDRDAYKLVAQEAIHALADLTTRHRRQSARYYALLDHMRKERQAAA